MRRRQKNKLDSRTGRPARAAASRPQKRGINMSAKLKYTGFVLFLAAAFATVGVLAHDEAEGDPYFKIAKNGQVNFNSDVRIGEQILKKGKYIVQHRVDGTDHVFVFVDLKRESQQTTVHSKGVFPGDRSGESGVHGKEQKDRTIVITKIEMAAENMDHTF
jgi:hypothetical protein